MVDASMTVEQLQQKIESLEKKKSAAFQMEEVDMAVEIQAEMAKYEGVLAVKIAEEKGAKAEQAAAEKSGNKVPVPGVNLGRGMSSAHSDSAQLHLNHMVLLVSYVLYCLSGLAMIITGMVYVGSTGTMGSTGFGLLLLGVGFICLGYVALQGWSRRNGFILMLVELVMVAMYFILFIVIIGAIMLGTGARDPVQRLFDDNWDRIKEQVYAGTPMLYEQQCTNGVYASKPSDTEICNAYIGKFRSLSCVSVTVKGRPENIGAYGINCTRFGDSNNEATAGVDCDQLQKACVACESQCKRMLVAHSKQKNVGACALSIASVIYMMGVVALHTLCRAGFYTGWSDKSGDGDSGDTESGNPITSGNLSKDSFDGDNSRDDFLDTAEGGNEKPLCCKSLGHGWIVVLVNAGFALFGLSFIVIAIVTVRSPTDGDLSGSMMNQEGMSNLWVWLLLVGIVLSALPMIQIGLVTTHQAPNYILDIVVAVLIFVMMLISVFLGFLSGALVEDINSLYDENYAKYRGEIELYSPTYCQLSEGDCSRLTRDPSAKIWPVAGVTAADMQPIDREDLWKNQHQALQLVPYKNLPPNNFLHTCESSDLCIRCFPALEALKAAKPPFVFNHQTIRVSGGARNASLDGLKVNVKAWAAVLFNVTEHNRDAKLKLKKCEIALDAMAGGGVNDVWAKFPNPADKCKAVHFALQYGFENAIVDEFTGAVIKPASSVARSAELYNDTQTCAEYLISMTTSSPVYSACSADTACRDNIKANFALVYKYMDDAKQPFCQLPDQACKDKIAFEIAAQMRTVGVGGAFVLLFQLLIIFTTYWGIQDYGISFDFADHHDEYEEGIGAGHVEMDE